MRSLLLLLLPLLALGCPANLASVCDLPTDLPTDVDDGRGKATRSDGAAFNELASWSPGTNASVDVGLLDMILAKDETGTDFDQLVGDNAFPFCVRLGARGDKTGQADDNESASVSDATHTGGVAVLKLDANTLIGRFQVTVVNSGTGAVISFTDGAFKAHRL